MKKSTQSFRGRGEILESLKYPFASREWKIIVKCEGAANRREIYGCQIDGQDFVLLCILCMAGQDSEFVL